MKTTPLLTLLVCFLFSTIAPGALASTTAGYSKSGTANVINSREEALQLVKGQYKGKVLKVQPSQPGSSPGYKIKMLSKKGVVFNVSVEAKTGTVLRN